MQDDTTEGRTKIQIVPLFPLPNTVFFPHTSLPLHIFEPRYRAMTRDAARGEGLIVVSLMDGAEFNRLATVGRLQDLEALEDGRFNLCLEGLERVSIVEVASDTPYRQVRIEPRPERVGTDDASVIDQVKLDLLAAHGMLRSLVQQEQPVVLHQELSFEAVVNTTCSSLPIEAALRQQLLAEDDLVERQRRATDYLSAVMDALSQLRGREQGRDSLLN